jgi:hypothetical protein
MTPSIVIGRRFRGPAGSGNGGSTCGLVAGLLNADTVEVTLRLPPPLDAPLRVERADDSVRRPLGGDGRRLHAGTALFRDDRPLAVARAVSFMVGDDVRDGTLPRVNGR